MQDHDQSSERPRIAPVRGIVLAQSRAGACYPASALRRWIRANRAIYKAPKIDLFVRGLLPTCLDELLEHAQRLDARLSLRTDCEASIPGLNALKAAGLFDVFLCPLAPDSLAFNTWLDACAAAGLPIRIQFQGPFPSGFSGEDCAERLARAGVTVANLALYDPLALETAPMDAAACRDYIDTVSSLARQLSTRNVETNLLRFPYCHFDEELWPYIIGDAQFFLDHSQYQRASFEFAQKTQYRGPIIVSKLINALLVQNSSLNPALDAKLFPWLLEHPALNARLWFLHKLTRHFRWRWLAPKPRIQDGPSLEQAVARAQEKRAKAFPPACGNCQLRNICLGDTPLRGRLLPGLTVQPLDGEPIPFPMCFCKAQAKHYDAIDAQRAQASDGHKALAEEALRIVHNEMPTRKIDAFEYEIEGQYAMQMLGGMRWFSITPTEKQSTILARLEPPFTLAVTFCAGSAEYIGFSFGRHCKTVCAMDSFNHCLALHVAADGHYVLLRDDIPVHPMEFEGVHYAPLRLAGMIEPRICIGNIDGAIVTQNVCLWEHNRQAAAVCTGIRYSFLIFSTRYARRLQAVLQSIAHQRDYDLSRVEVIVAYVPGIDAVDDLLDSFHISYPAIHIVRSPFTEHYARSKGFVINESVCAASGEWVILLDSDIILPPEMLSEMEKVEAQTNFIAPDGRKMLEEEATARILMGEVRPWESWDALVEGPGEFRLREAEGAPIGFFQAVRRSCLDEIKYMEMDHFEWADLWFGIHMREKFGREVRTSGAIVLHMDHGGSQWYGTAKHR